jgi:hypothetical protein
MILVIKDIRMANPEESTDMDKPKGHSIQLGYTNNRNRLEQETLAQVRSLYEKSAQTCRTNDRELFSIPLADMLTHPWQSLQT